MPPKFHTLAGFPPSVSPSSHAAEVNGLVFLTGQFGRDLDNPAAALPDGIDRQTERALENMRRALQAIDLDLENVISVRVFLTRFKRDYEAMNRVYAKYFQGSARPTRTCVGVSELVHDALIEIDCIAAR